MHPTRHQTPRHRPSPSPLEPAPGARPMRRAVERYLEDPLAEEILKSNIHDGEPVQVSAEEEKLTFTQKAAAEEALSGQ